MYFYGFVIYLFICWRPYRCIWKIAPRGLTRINKPRVACPKGFILVKPRGVFAPVRQSTTFLFTTYTLGHMEHVFNIPLQTQLYPYDWNETVYRRGGYSSLLCSKSWPSFHFRGGGGYSWLLKTQSSKSWTNFHFRWGEVFLATQNSKSQVLTKFSFPGGWGYSGHHIPQVLEWGHLRNFAPKILPA